MHLWISIPLQLNSSHVGKGVSCPVCWHPLFVALFGVKLFRGFVGVEFRGTFSPLSFLTVIAHYFKCFSYFFRLKFQSKRRGKARRTRRCQRGRRCSPEPLTSQVANFEGFCVSFEVPIAGKFCGSRSGCHVVILCRTKSAEIYQMLEISCIFSKLLSGSVMRSD